MPRAEDDRQPEVLIRFGRDDEFGHRMEQWATDYVIFYRDQFGTAIMHASPEDREGDWWQFLYEVVHDRFPHE